MPPFEIIPAIDLLGGRCVRLAPEGRFDAAPLFEADPAALARRYASQGAPRLHAVDLDGARSGRPENADAIAAIAAVAGRIPLQVGGGMRTLADLEARLALGVERVILGTVALRDPALVREAARRWPGRVAVGIDARGGRVAVQGWLEESDVAVVDLARRFEDAGVAALVHTDIARDGTLAGPNLEATARLAEAVRLPVIASGGVGSEDDVRAAAKLGLAGIVIGRALHAGTVQLARALEIAACC
ncbi:MAG TPA: 1-(5-phosphoribosyl)-5-[(5-phosphoribosylamino)methylideneamino]imidazole-4-carboxamide isomerase [Myxococcota bacterium]|nr:1-(5-phosphoribosyl)-5-[(5-phosphoribosylamino)methylideneamino]imidazole-4-carboxamide isomerase [Myxococcota bacterium]